MHLGWLLAYAAYASLRVLTLTASLQASHPEVAARIQAEVDAVTGGGRAVSLSDKAAMPYTEATILEALRVASSPIVPHVATQDTSIAGK